jgi:hypothetical protein
MMYMENLKICINAVSCAVTGMMRIQHAQRQAVTCASRVALESVYTG